MKTDLSKIKPESFNYRLLNDLFWSYCGKGNSVLMVGGVQVRKSLERHESSTGKSSSFSVVYSWKSKDGKDHQIKKPSRFEGANGPTQNKK